mgnify:CR=1 FL=1
MNRYVFIFRVIDGDAYEVHACGFDSRDEAFADALSRFGFDRSDVIECVA